VLSPKSYAEMITPSKLNDGTRLRYSMGLTVGEDSRGVRYIGHNGGGFGFSSEARWYPSDPRVEPKEEVCENRSPTGIHRCKMPSTDEGRAEFDGRLQIRSS
jgi:hypothetical protein